MVQGGGLNFLSFLSYCTASFNTHINTVMNKKNKNWFNNLNKRKEIFQRLANTVFFTAGSIVYIWSTQLIKLNVCIQGYLRILWIQNTKPPKKDEIHYFMLYVKLKSIPLKNEKLDSLMGIKCNTWRLDGNKNLSWKCSSSKACWERICLLSLSR